MSAAELFTFDRARLRLITEADPTGYIGTLERPAQACRVVFLAAELDAIRWDVSRWPELEFGVWCDEPAEQPTQNRRRRALNDDISTELSTWLQLRRSWPQLGGPSIPWPLPTCPPGPEAFNERLTALVATAVEALNTTHRRTLLMAQALAGPGRADKPGRTLPPNGVNMQASTTILPAASSPFAPPGAPSAASPFTSPGMPSVSSPIAAPGANPASSPFASPGMPNVSSPATSPGMPAASLRSTATQTMQSVADPVTRTFVATAVAAEQEIGAVLAMLVRDAEANAMRGHPAGHAPALYLNHTVLPLTPPPFGPHPPANNHPTRFLVTLTATQSPRHHP